MSNSGKYKHLLLTSSLDWTVKLWTTNNLSQPLYEFFSPTCDYVCDVQWSPTHPGVFLTISSTGKVALWNLAKSLTEPVDILSVSKESDDAAAGDSTASGVASLTSSVGGHGKSFVLPKQMAPNFVSSVPSALNKVLFSRDGQFLIVGDSSGVLHRLKVHPSHVTITPGDESRLSMVLMSASTMLLSQSPQGKQKREESLFSRSGTTASSLLDDMDDESHIQLHDSDKN